MLEDQPHHSSSGVKITDRSRAAWTQIWQSRYLTVVVLLISTLVVGTLLNPAFFTLANLDSGLVIFFVELGIGTLAEALVMLVNGIDLSVGSVIGLVGLVAGMSIKAGVPVGIAVAAALAVGAICGLINGLLVTRLSMPSVIATLGSGILFGGIALGISGGQASARLPAAYQWFGQGRLGVLPVQFVILVILVSVIHFILSSTPYGRWVYAIGGGETAAHFSGIPVKRVLVIIYTLSGFLAGVTGIVMSARFNSAKSNLGAGIELGLITAALLGGIGGGQGTAFGAMLGMLAIATLQNGLTLGGVNMNVQAMIIGVILVTVIVIERYLAPKRLA